MSFCTDHVLLLAGSIFTGLGSPSAQSVGYVSGWLTSSGTLGGLNNRLNTAFYLSGASPCIAGGFGPNEGEILRISYERDYYLQQSRAALVGGGKPLWTSIGEADTRVTRASPVEESRGWLALSKDSEQSLYVAVANWKKGAVLASSVDYSSLYSYPTP